MDAGAVRQLFLREPCCLSHLPHIAADHTSQIHCAKGSFPLSLSHRL